MTWLRLLESIHGHLGVLAAAILIHPAWLLRRGRSLSRGARWSVALAGVLPALAFASGVFIYGDYRREVKRALFARSVEAGMLFETKEHLAFAVVAFALSGAAAAWFAPKQAPALRRSAATFYAVAAVLCLVTLGLGTHVASLQGFPE